MHSTQNTAPVRVSCAAWTRRAAAVVRPVCVAAVILDPAAPVDGVNDSKKLSEKKRELLYPQIIEKALAYKVVMVGPQTIDELNILNATLLGMRQAVEGLAVRPGLALIDGNRCPEMEIPAQSVVKGDARSASISAASILAKVSRDPVHGAAREGISSIPAGKAQGISDQAALRAAGRIRHSAVLPQVLFKKTRLCVSGRAPAGGPWAKGWPPCITGAEDAGCWR